MRTKRLSKRLTAIVLALVLAVSLVPVMGESVAVHADPAFEKDMTNTWLGTEGITDPEQATATSVNWNGSYVYFGNYNNIPVKYRVLAKDTDMFSKDIDGKKAHTMFLDCDSVLFNGQYNNIETTPKKVWSESSLYNELNTNFIENQFSDVEKNALAESYRDDHALTDDPSKDNAVWTMLKDTYSNYVGLNGEKLFVLDVEDVFSRQFGYKKNGNKTFRKNKINTTNSSYWWLRSLNEDYFALIENGGELGGARNATDKFGVSPALNLKLSSILFSSLTDESNKEYKLTLIKKNDCYLVCNEVSATGKTFTIKYDVGGDPSGYNRKSVFITDKEWEEGNTNKAKLLYYGKLNTISDGIGTFDLPGDLDISGLGTDYHIYITYEIAYTNPKVSDYACMPVEVNKIKVSSISLDETEKTVAKEANESIIATITPSYVFSKNVTWTSSNDSIVHITDSTDASCSFVANGIGTAVITATADNGTLDTSDDKTATCTVTVVEKMTDASLKTNLSLYEGFSEKLNVVCDPVNAPYKTLTCISDDPSVATVDENGLVTAVSVGETDIRVTVRDYAYTDFGPFSCHIEVKPASYIDQVNLTDVVAPEALEPFSYTVGKAEGDSEDYDINRLEWAYLDGAKYTIISSIGIGAPIADHATEYTAIITLETNKSDVFFAEGLAANINSSTPSLKEAVVSVYPDRKKVDIFYTFPRTALEPIIIYGEDKTVAYAETGIAIPVEGMFTNIPDKVTSTYTVEEVTGKGVFNEGILSVSEIGTFEVTVNTNPSSRYGLASKTFTLTVLPKTIDTPEIILSNDSFIYDGTEKKPTVTLKAAGAEIPAAEYVVTYPKNPVNAGEYTVSVKNIEGGKYTMTGSKTYTITKIDPAYTVPEGLKATEGDRLSSIALPEGWAWSTEYPDTESFATAGTVKYKAVYTPKDTANYNAVAGIEISIEVSAAYSGGSSGGSSGEYSGGSSGGSSGGYSGGSSGGSSGGYSGGSSGGSSGEYSGGSSGGSSGGYSGGSSGGSSGGYSGGSSGGSSGGYSGGSSGGSSGGYSGGSSGGSSGGYSGGSSGGSGSGSAGGSTGGSGSGSTGSSSGGKTGDKTGVTSGSGSSTSGEKTGDKNNDKNTVVKIGTLLKDASGKRTYRVTSKDESNLTVEFVSTSEKSKKITIPKTVKIDGVNYKVTSIAKNALKGNKKVKNIVVGANVETIEAYAFKDCTKLTAVTVGSKVTKIGKGAFSGCKVLKTLTIGKNVSKIEKDAFKGCKALEKLIVKTKLLTEKNVANKVFKPIPAACKVTVPKKTGKLYTGLFTAKGLSKKISLTVEK